MDAGRIAYNPRSQGLYSSRSVSLFKISMFTSFIAIVVGGVGPKLGGQDHLQPRMGPRAMVRVSGRETLSGTISVATSDREGAAAPPAIT